MQLTVSKVCANFSGKTKFPPVLLLVFIVFITKTGIVSSLVVTGSPNDNKLVGKEFGKQSGATPFNIDSLQGNRSLSSYKLNSCKNDGYECNGPDDFETHKLPPGYYSKCCGDCVKDSSSRTGYLCKNCIPDAGDTCPASRGCCTGLYCNVEDSTCTRCIELYYRCNPTNDGCCTDYYCHGFGSDNPQEGTCEYCLGLRAECDASYKGKQCCEGLGCNTRTSRCTICLLKGEVCSTSGDPCCDDGTPCVEGNKC